MRRGAPAARDACAAGRVGISASASRISEGERALADVAPINWTNAVTLISVAILVGTELVGAGAAAGWAIGGLFQLGEPVTRALEGVLILTALTGLFYFLRAAVAHEPIRGSPVARLPPGSPSRIAANDHWAGSAQQPAPQLVGPR